MTDFLKRIADFSPKRLLLLAAELEERVRELEAQNAVGQSAGSHNRAPIAVIGMGCRFPGGVRDAETFWELLSEGRDAISEVPKSRWDVDELYDPDPHARGKVATKWGGFLDAPEMFDAHFFGIAPVEAVGMDPQQRLLLEVSWEALEDAGIAPSSLNGSKTGVYIGLCNTDYGQLAMNLPGEQIEAYFAQGASHAVAAGRISYFLGLRGPSLAIDTACSSSLVAIHEACQSLRMGESELALAGGANLLFCPEVTMALSRAQMMAADGRCKAFSAAANGFVRSEGCGVVVLKRLDAAERDGDRVLAVIRGTALNQDGRSSGLTAPNGPSQVSVISAALEDAGIAPEAVSYVESHGTGTSLGDTIEMQALGEALGRGRADDALLPVGSVKSNFGHAESAAGVAGLIKLVLALGKKTIPASLHCALPNPKIDWDAARTRVPVMEEPWLPAAGFERRVGAVSSFGFSGTNAHLVVAEAPAVVTADANSGTQVITLSARSEEALQAMAGRLADRLRDEPGLRVQDVAYTLAAGRSALSHRAALRVVAGDYPEAVMEELHVLAQGAPEEGESRFVRGVAGVRAPRVAFLFAGQGGERTGMGLSLLEQSEVFRAAVAEVDAALAGVIPASIETIFRNEGNELAQSALVQPALFAFQYGLARVWQSWGVEPDIVVGHSMGELVAATLAGVMSLRDAALLIAARGRLTGELGDPGGMVAVAASEEQVSAELAPYRQDVSIAAINGAASVVISGRKDAVELAAQHFEQAGVRVKRLNITYGSHSPAMHRVLPAFHAEAVKASYFAPRLPIIADLTGQRVEDASVFNAQYWTSHLSRPVQFARCLAELEKEGCELCIEMGPRAVLTAFGKERGDAKTRWVASANGREDDFDALQLALAEAFTAGAELDWKEVYRGRDVRKVALPTYPFERERYWIGDGQPEASHAVQRGHAGRVRTDLPMLSADGLNSVRLDASLPIFETELSTPLPWHLEQHRVGGRVVLPASAYLSLAWAAAQGIALSSGKAARITDFSISRPLQPGDDAVLVQTALMPVSREKYSFRMNARVENTTEWSLHATGSIADYEGDTEEAPRFDRTKARRMSGDEYYRHLDVEGIHLGAAFRGIQQLWYLPGASVGHVLVDPEWHTVEDAALGPHPALLDACFQVLGAAAIEGGDTRLRLMTAIDEICVVGELRGLLTVEARLTPRADGVLDGGLWVFDECGTSLAVAKGIQLRPMAALEATAQAPADWLYEQAWEVSSLPFDAAALSHSARHKWVLLGSSDGIAARVAERLAAAGEQVRVISDAAIIADLQAEGSSIEFVDLRMLDGVLLTAGDDFGVVTANTVGASAVGLTAQSLSLWQAVVKQAGYLWLFTNDAQAVRSTQRIAGALQATVWGLARCATLEHPERLRRIVDLDPEAAAEQRAAIVARELLSHNEEEQIAYAGEARLAYRLKRMTAPEQRPLVLRKEGSYLLTGGVGGLGLRAAAWLAKQGAGTLVLTTRSFKSAAARQSEIDALRASGVAVEIIAVDVADAVGMKELFARFGQDLPALRGVLHMAADVSGAPIEEIDEGQIRAMFQAKITGTWLMHELTRTLPLDFFVAYSSTAAVLGSSGLGNYAAANCFIDAVAGLRKSEGLPFLSVNWGTWQTMRLASAEQQQQYSSGGMMPMDDGVALAWLAELIQSGVSHATVANVQWQLLAPLYELKRPRHWLQYLRQRQATPQSSHAPMWTPEPGESRLAALDRVVQKEASRILGLRRGELPGSDTRLADLGLDSLMAVTLRNRLQAMIGQDLPPTFAFEYPTPSEMAIALDMLLWGSGVEDEHSTTERDEIQI